MNKLLDRFFHYVAFDTQSKINSRKTPSSDGQLKLAKSLEKELIALGLQDVSINADGCVIATLPSNVNWEVPVIGFLAYLDTTPELSGRGVNPQLIEQYRGGEVALGTGEEVLSPIMFPIMRELIGQSLITTDGNTLLGADDKAGIAEIVTAIATLKQKNRPHGEIRIAFVPDQKIGKGADCLDIKKFAAKWVYAVDSAGVGSLEYENFNAASAVVKIVGNNIHPGNAKGVMVNALMLAMNFQHALPQDEVPELTKDYEGFYHLTGFKGTVELAEMEYIIRDFSQEGFKKRKQRMLATAEEVGKGLHPACYIEVTITDSYYNMKDEIMKHPHIIEIAKQAMEDLGITPIFTPIRASNNGAKLSYRGLPCISIFTGGYNFHSKHEMITLEGMEKAVTVIQRIAELTASIAKK